MHVLRQFINNLNYILVRITAFLTISVAITNSASLALAENTCPQLTLADHINNAVSPVTNAVSDIIFFPVPVLPGEDVSRGAIIFDRSGVADGSTLTLKAGDQRFVLEFDTDGTLCTSGEAISKTLFEPQRLREYLRQRLPDTWTVDTRPNGLVFTVPDDLEVSISASGAGLSAEQFTTGAVGIPFIVIWLLIGAVFFTARMGFVNLRCFKHAVNVAKGTYDNPSDPGEVTHFQALTAALSGTVGLGNIAGVALAISIGGAGATFWMILAGLLGMSSKFVECTLGVHYRSIDASGVVSGGPMYYLTRGLAENGKPQLGKILAVVFALLCIGGAFGAGGLFQVNQSTAQLINTLTPLTGGEASFLNGKPWLIGMLYAALVGLVIIGGIRSITRVTEKLVPMMAFVYLSGALVVLAINVGEIPSAIGEIFAGAFLPSGVAGGFVGVLVQGLRRATFSNEAGVGSAAIAHAAVKTTEPVSEGVVALLEPFIDTVVICTITALVIIVTDRHEMGIDLGGIGLTSSAFASAIGWFPYILTVAVALFAFSTSITWFYYGQRAFLYLVGERPAADLGFKLFYLIALIIGSSMTLGAVMDFADAMLLAMAFPNMIGLYILAPQVKAMLDSYLSRLRTGDIAPYTKAKVA